MNPAKVYYTDLRTRDGDNLPKKLQRLIRAAGIADIDMEKKFVAIKLHFGEPGNLSFLRPNYAKAVADVVKELGGIPFLTDCNTLYVGRRKHALEHLEAAQENGFSPLSTGCQIIIADGLKGTDEVEVPVEGGEYVTAAKIGRAVMDADIFISLAHFKGHDSTGFGGAIKNISIGIASAHGKAYIHGAGDPEKLWTADHDSFLESMADAAKSIVSYFNGKMAFINVMCNMSVDCDCCAVAEDPAIADIGILASLDPVALDQACVDLVYQSEDPGKPHLIERIESRNGIHTVEAAEALGFGSREYELIHIL